MCFDKIVGMCYKKNILYGDGFYVWTAGQRQTTDYSLPFVWKPNNSTSLPVVYYNWLDGQPSRNIMNYELCLNMAHAYRWDDTVCENPRCALCEYGHY